MTRFYRLAGGLTLAAAGLLGWAAFPQAQTSGLRFVAGWAKMPAGEWEIARVAVDPNGKRFFAFRRMDPPIVELDPESGKVIAQWGDGMFVAPHGMRVDREGNLWVTDTGRLGLHNENSGLVDPIESALKAGRGYQVSKFSPDRKLLMTLGKQGVRGIGPDTFGSPSDVIVADNGDIFVADGHEGAEEEHPRIVKFTRDGRFIKQWGKKGKGPGEFSIPHALAFDSRGRLLVADRGNGRIQVFTQEGDFVELWTTLKGGSGIAVGLNDTLYSTAGHQLLIGSAKDGSLRETVHDVWAEGVTADSKGNVWVGEVYRRAIKKFVDETAPSKVSRR